MAQGSYGEVTPKPRNDVYVGMLAISLLAMIGGCVLLYLDLQRYGDAKPPDVQPLPSTTDTDSSSALPPLPGTGVVAPPPPAGGAAGMEGGMAGMAGGAAGMEGGMAGMAGGGAAGMAGGGAAGMAGGGAAGMAGGGA